MSTFGTALVVDVAPGGELRGIAAALKAVRSSPAVAHQMESGWTRVVAATSDIETLARITAMPMSAGTCRAAVSQDYDEYGALWVVLSAYQGSVRTRSSPVRAQRQPAAPAAGPRSNPEPRR